MKETADFHPAPEWLTKEYLVPILRKYKKDATLDILKLDIKPATAKGDNYASIMTRINVDFSLKDGKQKQNGSYIVKTSIENDAFVASAMSGYECYKTEMHIYEQVLPKLSQLLKEIGDDSKIFADTIHVDYERSAIIFEDLTISNFVIVDRLAGMDLTHVRMTLKKLAKMHATAAVLNERIPGALEKYDHGIFNKHTKAFSVFFENIIEVCANFAKDCKDLGPYYTEKLMKLKKRVMEYGANLYGKQIGQFNTLNHGDLWVNNIMVRYNNNKAQINYDNNNNISNGISNDEKQQQLNDLILIDFQFSCWTSPALDLHYFFNTSLKLEDRLQHLDSLIQCYYLELNKTLRSLKFKGYIPSLHEFHIQLEQNSLLAVIFTMSCQAVLKNDQTEDADLNALICDNERSRKFRNTLYCNKYLQDSVKALLPIYDRRGLLDIAD